MSLLAPLGLLGLVALPLIVAFYMLRLRREERTVGSTWLWQQLVRDVEANTPWQKLRRSLLLLLQLLLALLLVLAVARPALDRPAGLSRDLVLVVDASASMGATDETPDRLAAARRAAIQALGDLPADGKVSVIAAAESARVMVNEAADKERAARAIAAIEPSTAPADLGDALRLAGALAARATGAEVLVVTDAAAGAIPSDLHIDAPVRVLTVGTRGDNQSIAALAVRADPAGLERRLFVSIANLSERIANRRLQILADGSPVTARDLALEPLVRTQVIIDDLPPGIRTVEARLAPPEPGTDPGPPDLLPIDDAAWAVVPDDRLRRILLVGPGNVYLQNALTLLPGVELYGATPDEWPTTTGKDSFDLIVFDGWLPEALPPSPILAIAPPATSELGAVDGTLDNPTVGVPPAEEPLLDHVDLTRLHVARAQRITAPSWARTVLAADDGSPLILSGQRDGLPATVIAFDLHQSDLPLQVAWPILLANLTGELLGTATALDPVTPATPVDLPLRPGVTALRVTLPDGTVRELAPGATGASSVAFVETRQLGVYRVEEVRPDGGAGADATPLPVASAAAGASPATGASPVPAVAATTADTPPIDRFAVDLLSVSESAIAPSDPARIVAIGTTAGSDPDTAAPGTARDEWWPWLVALILLALLAEWALYERDGARRIWAAIRHRRPGSAPAPGAR
ncbi:MAG: VWA domain-containing protein [Chloroflexota bacterium]